MKEGQHIDELLKSSFGNFQPEAPVGAWEGIRQGLSQLPASAVPAAKGLSLLGKVVLSLAIPAAVMGGYFAYKAVVSPSTPVAVQTQPAPAQDPLPLQPAQDAAPSVTKKEELLPPPEKHVGRKQRTRPELRTAREAEGVETSRPGLADQLLTTQEKDYLKPTEPAEKAPANVAANPPAPRPVPKQTMQKKSRAIPPGIFGKEPVASDPAREEKPKVYNVFTPNNDGENDRFVIQIENESFFYLKVLDQNSNIVFESTDKNNQWDGINMKTGEPCESGTYIYLLKYQYRNAAEPGIDRGSVQIRRSLKN